ncbi:MinD/ParA family protein [uncultured Fretibacterium sp.]|uniref:MinD/ParA family protein n=1 Tax=uncultured Fretibacterium sp. TaxID=1678694 RepID=UPI0026051D89|nr:MinD/ParA family protein [uncultured Fretibacterium sp.]
MNPAPSDQAGDLRRLVEARRQEVRRHCGNGPRTVAVLSGKGGVGKSNLALALTCALADSGNRVVLLDADLGMANIDLLCGIGGRFNLSHVVDGSRRLDEVVVSLEENVEILPGGSGLKDLADLDDTELSGVIDSLGLLEDRADIVILDTGAGIHKGVLAFALAADTTILVTTPEPTSVRDAYGVLKSLEGASPEGKELLLVVNMAGSGGEAREVAGRILTASHQFLGRSPVYLGHVLRDDAVGRAVRLRRPFYRLFPSAPAGLCVRRLADDLLARWGVRRGFSYPPRGLKAFFLRLSRGFFMEK